MKKRILLLLVTILMIAPGVLAKNYYDDYNTLNLEGALKEEGIALENKSYKETSDQAIIYVFRGNGCGFCRNLLTYLSSLTKTHGKYFKVVSFEVWYDQKNSELLSKVATITGNDPSKIGVPFYVIGDKVFSSGYGDNMNQEIVDAIMNEYNNHGTDIFTKVAQYDDGTLVIPDTKTDTANDGKTDNYSTSSSGSDTFAIVFWNFFFVAVGTMVVVYLNIKNKQEILKAIEEKENTKEFDKKKKDNKKEKKDE